MSRVSVHGGGIAASTCAHLLKVAGQEVIATTAKRKPVPSILISDGALSLLRDAFSAPDLFNNQNRITRRVVAWGGQDPVEIPHRAIVVSGEELDGALRVGPHETSQQTQQTHFTIHTNPPFPAGATHRFGARQAMAAPVKLAIEDDQTAFWIESVEDGWIFLAPSSDKNGWLLAVGNEFDHLVVQSRHIRPRIVLEHTPVATFDTAPRLHTPLSGANWLACGGAALAFDPICGDGAAQAVREAILAAAVVVGIAEGEDRDALLVHYHSMLVAAMRRHLRMCAAFYDSGGQSDWWREQLNALAEGFDWCTALIATYPEPRFALEGFRIRLRETKQ